LLGAAAGMTLVPAPRSSAGAFPPPTAFFPYYISVTQAGSTAELTGAGLPASPVNCPAVQPQLMAPGTSPSVVALPGLGFESAFQGANGDLWFSGTSFTGDADVQMAPGTSPALTSVNGTLQAAWDGPNGDVWITGANGPVELGIAVAPGTRPAIAGLSGGGYEVAVHAANGDLWTAGTLPSGNTRARMAAGTSPSIAATIYATPGALPASDYYIAYGSANGGQLVLYDWHTGSGPVPGASNVASGTTPSIAILGE
jgi:hypothetical protein